MRRLILAALLSVCACPALADTRPLRVVLFDIAPYASQIDGKPQGLYVDWLRGFLGPLGLQAEFQLRPFARIAPTLEQREADLTISFATDTLWQAALPLGPVPRVDSVVVTRTGWPSGKLESLQGASLGRARGGCLDLAERPELHLRWTEINGFDKALRMLELGRLDGVCQTRDVLRHQLPLLGMNRAQLGPEIVVGHRVAQLFARKTLEPALLAQLQAALAQRSPMQRD
ncbi:transporter substrate-binding domain-containing protein [Roseateles asaccharophilus]|uniref:ABC-type amino acid transport substrate-binding protein n=1 Tax=Roseateles asaccharophilus TaxID=582607 RepID=A0ABU2ABE0_9BURK|nr:transporter substrate-binding domain-containing protein [Roseateles asaccharophilus]MDR7334511.1 ABC-type amino acid transport substrate-binding protein [Roseateles asaccharophilus]